MSLLETVEVFSKLHRAVSIVAARLCYVNKLTDHLIKRNEDKVRGSIKVIASIRAKTSWKICCDPLLKEMERGFCE
jgi:ribulose 1,5-bisphosphate synthetase/thiazole synthase